MGSIAIALEEKGIPTVTLYNQRHEKRFMGTILQKGYVDYPAINFDEYETFTSEGIRALAPEAFDFMVEGLTTWTPPYLKPEGDRWVPKESAFTYSGDSYQESLDLFNRSYLEMGWGDGLPLMPPTRERVDALLRATPVSAETVIGRWGPSNAYFTAEKIAVAAAMAGARPEYMPVIIAALEAVTSSPWDAFFPVMRSAVPLIIVNGPYAGEIGINSSSNAFGPNPAYPANGAIGRAVNLALAAIPGNGRGIKPSNLAGNPASYAGIVVAEAEGVISLTPGWDPVSVQMGYPAGTNLVTVMGVDQMDMSVLGSIDNIAACVAPNRDIWPGNRKMWEAQYAGALVITEMQIVIDGQMGGKTKADYARELWESARFPVDEFRDLILRSEFGEPVEPSGFVKSLLEEPDVVKKGVPVAAGPDRFLVLVAGGH
ncbi:MAG: hypothetical protein JW793_03580 [Acidobacteria bacterium]|nr:hypothetical protein [Acidobacteriota bacterium]